MRTREEARDGLIDAANEYVDAHGRSVNDMILMIGAGGDINPLSLIVPAKYASKVKWPKPNIAGIENTEKPSRLEALRMAIQEIINGEEYYMGKESAQDYDATIEAICEALRDALKEC